MQADVDVHVLYVYTVVQYLLRVLVSLLQVNILTTSKPLGVAFEIT